MPVETFPGHVNNIYLILDGDVVTLFDVGSGLPDSNGGSERRMAEVRERFGGVVTLASVQHVVISHAHIDHFGWVGRFTGESDAVVYVHELDARVLVNFEERIVLASKDLRVFMERAGVKPKPGPRSRKRTAGQNSSSRWRSTTWWTATASSTGIACTTPPGTVQGRSASRSMTSSSPRTTCCRGSRRISRRPRSRPSADSSSISSRSTVQSRASASRSPATKRPSRTSTAGSRASWAITSGGSARCSTSAMSRWRFQGGVQAAVRSPGGYTRLLALEEAGAHVEYLFQRGELRIANLEDVTRENNPVIRYEDPVEAPEPRCGGEEPRPDGRDRG